jgi:putative Mg2+ transporter-C (MgtC) family protein
MDILQRVWIAIQSEFADLGNVEQFTQVALRLFMAALLGGVIGFEREAKRKPAGLRTHILVALGSAMFVVMPLQAGVAVTDLSRILQGLVAGIGFLGAGAIVHGSKSNHGLTTAASIWLTAAIGASVGMGREGSAVLGTCFTLAVLFLLQKVTANIPKVEKGSGKVPKIETEVKKTSRALESQ